LARRAWDEIYRGGISAWPPRQDNPEWRAINDCVSHWYKESPKRLTPIDLAHAAGEPPSPHAPGPANDHQSGEDPSDRKVTTRRSPKEFVDASKREPKRSYEKFAARLGISGDTLYAITKEKRWVSDANYERVAKACDCKPEDLHPRDIPRPQHRQP
jgi:hypothetical protein